MICPPDHKHGEAATCYILHKCRCAPCRNGGRLRENKRARLKAYGRYDTGLVDAEPVREHVRALMEFGIGWDRIAAIAGVSKTMTRMLMVGREDYRDGTVGPRHGHMQKRMKRENAEALLAVQPELRWLGERTPYPAVGTQRRIAALMCNGWSLSELGRRIGADETSLSRTMKQEQTWALRARLISDLYDELWDKHPVPRNAKEAAWIERTKQYARRHRFVPAMGWDDIDADPEPPKTEPIGHRPASVVEREEAVRRLYAQLYSDRRIAEEIGVDPRTVFRIRHRLGLPGLTQEQLEAA